MKKADAGGTAFADLVWKPIVLIEMKKRGVDLRKHFRQAFDYWTRLVPNRPRYVVLCNFDEFWVYDFENQMDYPVDQLPLVDLPDNWGPLAFLFPGEEQPIFGSDHDAVTRKAADRLANCFNNLIARHVDRASAQRFTLQMLVSLFSEHIGLLDQYFVTRLIEECQDGGSSFDLIGGLFNAMNTPGGVSGGRFKGVKYFNGGLFASPALIDLAPDELSELRVASRFNWATVSPEIFGTIFEHTISGTHGGKDERHAHGSHFTSPADIMKIITPTIVEPWREQIENASTVKRLNDLLGRIHSYTVLDPACGSGNFLYIAYRELKRLEARLFDRLAEKSSNINQGMFGFVDTKQFYGLDINSFAIELAKVTMMIARKLAIDEFHTIEPALPLGNLDSNFIVRDALIDKAGHPTAWPQVDVIIGNPPFLDARKMTIEFGRTYVGLLEAAYPEVPRRADYCTYWIRKTNDAISNCLPSDRLGGRAGLVGTQNIRNNQSRIGGLDYVVSTGTIVEAVDNQPWSGEAVVHVSIVNWIKTHDPAIIPDGRRLWSQVPKLLPAARRKPGKGSAAKEYELNFRIVDNINSALSAEIDVSGAKPLPCNRSPKKCFEGQQPGHKGFRIKRAEFLALPQDVRESGIVYPYLVGAEMVSGRFESSPQYVIDFGDRDILEASQFPVLMDLVRQRVLPKWQRNANSEHSDTGKQTGEHQNRLGTWWRLKRRRRDLIDSISLLPRYFVCVRHTKRPIFQFVNSDIRPDSSLTCFAFADDYSFGVLQSHVHWLWFISKCSNIKVEPRYTSDTIFDTFPWPQSPSSAQIDAIAETGRRLRQVRATSLAKKGGLRAMYRTLDMPGRNQLRDSHKELDAAVISAYGFSSKQDLLTQILKLNADVSARMFSGQAVVSPGIPPDYPHPKKLITDDCIKPK